MPPPAPPTPPGGYAPPPTAVTTQPGAPAGVVILRNWFAIWSLVLGIASLVIFCLGILFGIVAIVLGFLGINFASKRQGVGKTMSIVGIVLGALGVLAGILFVVFTFVIADSANDSIKNWTGKADPSTYTVKVIDCGTDTFDSPDMTISVTNRSKSPKQFTFDYEFRSGNGSILDTGTSFPTDSIPPNESMDIHISSFTSTTSSTVKCEVTGVNNWFN